MTDEERAEVYANENKIIFAYKETSEFVWQELKQAFLAGLKANRPQWHKVADGDLPKENKLYLATTREGGLIITYYNGTYWKTQYNISAIGYAVEVITAWCELPKYTEEVDHSYCLE